MRRSEVRVFSPAPTDSRAAMRKHRGPFQFPAARFARRTHRNLHSPRHPFARDQAIERFPRSAGKTPGFERHFFRHPKDIRGSFALAVDVAIVTRSSACRAARRRTMGQSISPAGPKLAHPGAHRLPRLRYVSTRAHRRLRSSARTAPHRESAHCPLSSKPFALQTTRRSLRRRMRTARQATASSHANRAHVLLTLLFQCVRQHPSDKKYLVNPDEMRNIT